MELNVIMDEGMLVVIIWIWERAIGRGGVDVNYIFILILYQQLCLPINQSSFQKHLHISQISYDLHYVKFFIHPLLSVLIQPPQLVVSAVQAHPKSSHDKQPTSLLLCQLDVSIPFKHLSLSLINFLHFFLYLLLFHHSLFALSVLEQLVVNCCC